MPRDIENMPFARSAPFATGESPSATPEATGRDASLRLENMLLEEFNYAGVTAYQAQEDRARMFNLYLLLIGVLGSGLAAVFQLGGGLKLYAGELSLALLLVAGLMGAAFFTKLIRLRQAWRESVLAMTLIKEYYIQEFSQDVPAGKPSPARAFYWRLATLPTGEKRTSTTAVVCFTVATLSAICFAGAMLDIATLWMPLALGARPAGVVPWALAVVTLFVAIILFTWGYNSAFDRVREAAQMLSVAHRGALPIEPIWRALKLTAAERERTLTRLRESKSDQSELLRALSELPAIK